MVLKVKKEARPGDDGKRRKLVIFMILRSSTTVNDRYSGDRFSGIDRFNGTKNPDDAILLTVSGITAIVENFLENFDANLSKVGILKLKTLYKTSIILDSFKVNHNLSLFLGVKRTIWISKTNF